MSSFSGFNINAVDHSMEEVLNEIDRLGYKAARTRRLEFEELDREMNRKLYKKLTKKFAAKLK